MANVSRTDHPEGLVGASREAVAKIATNGLIALANIRLVLTALEKTELHQLDKAKVVGALAEARDALDALIGARA